MIKEFFTKKGIKKLLSRIKLSGMPVSHFTKENQKNTINRLKSFWFSAVSSDMPADTFSQELAKKIKTSKRQSLTTLTNLMTGVRGKAREIINFGKKGRYYNNGVLDSNQTHICSSYMGESWDLPYSQIPDKPPRVGTTYHKCRSFLSFVEAGDNPPNEKNFITQFKEDEKLQYELLGKNRFLAMKDGDLKINSFKDYESAVLHNLDELGL